MTLERITVLYQVFAYHCRAAVPSLGICDKSLGVRQIFINLRYSLNLYWKCYKKPFQNLRRGTRGFFKLGCTRVKKRLRTAGVGNVIWKKITMIRDPKSSRLRCLPTALAAKRPRCGTSAAARPSPVSDEKIDTFMYALKVLFILVKLEKSNRAWEDAKSGLTLSTSPLTRMDAVWGWSISR